GGALSERAAVTASSAHGGIPSGGGRRGEPLRPRPARPPTTCGPKNSSRRPGRESLRVPGEQLRGEHAAHVPLQRGAIPRVLEHIEHGLAILGRECRCCTSCDV